jgi:proline iminopeptidase
MPAEFAELLAAMPATDDELAEFMDRLAPAYVHAADPADLRAAMAGTLFRVDAMRRGFDELARWSSVDHLGSIEVPVLLVFGRHDGFTGWPQADRIASRVRDAEVVVLERSGHMPWLDEPAEFVGAVRGWLDRHRLR